MSLIELNHISFAYEAEETPVLRDLSLTAEQGECLMVRGDNGSGKTTLFRILNGLSFPQSGTYTFDNTQITEQYLKDNRNAKLFHKRVGYLFQNPDLMLFNGRVWDEVAFGPRQMGLGEKEVSSRTEDCLKFFGIEALTDKAPYHLSGGQKKKVALAAVMALNPDVLILDEPLAGLDRKACTWLTAFLLELKAAGKTLVIATHDEQLAASLADRTLMLQTADED